MAIHALEWGFIAGSAAFIGALIAWFVEPRLAVTAAMMGFASGILLSIVAFDILDKSFGRGGFLPAAGGYLVGAVLFALGLRALERRGARGAEQPAEALLASRDASGIVALATVVEGVPEALIIGLSFAQGEGIALATVIAVFLSNVPEAQLHTARMKQSGRSGVYVFGVWLLVAVTTGLASLAGYLLLGDFRPEALAVIEAMAGGAFIVFITNAIIPEAFSHARDLTGVLAALGFLTGFGLSRLFH